MEVVFNLVVQLCLSELGNLGVCRAYSARIVVLGLLYCAQHDTIIHILRVGRVLFGSLRNFLCLLARLLLRRSQDLLHALGVDLGRAVAHVLEACPAVRELTGKCFHDGYFPDLSPAVLTLVHFLLVVLHPPEPILEE